MPDITDYDFELPPELIAQNPAERRDASRLMVVDRSSGDVSHKTFRDIAGYFSAGDCLIINVTKVVPARVFARKKTGGRVELLFIDGTDRALVKPSVPDGTELYFDGGEIVRAGEAQERGEGRRIYFDKPGAKENIIARYGVMPLPPYIKRKNADEQTLASDRRRYQTVYAARDGSIAAPTAGLHFTDELLDDIVSRKTSLARLTLHVGLGTFRSVTSERIENHRMAAERFILEEADARKINRAKDVGGAVTAVGTTCVRTVETLSGEKGFVNGGRGETSLYVYPGYEFKTVGRLVTNFHLPRSTPLFLAAAFCGRDLLFRAYREAVKERYRFFSYGDAMLIL